jgi:hypothetical protein
MVCSICTQILKRKMDIKDPLSYLSSIIYTGRIIVAAFIRKEKQIIED